MRMFDSSGDFFRFTQSFLLRISTALMVAGSAPGCAREPELVSVSATTFNYSQDSLLDIWVNGKSAGSLAKPAKLGEIKGGGVVCCISLSPAWKIVEVKIQATKGVEYTTQAKILQPWPQIASYAVVHVLPGRKVVIEISPTYVIPEPERLDELEQFAKDTK